MAKGKKTGGRDFVKGQVTNPNGRPKLPEHLKKARRMNKGKYEEILNKYMFLTKAELTIAVHDEETPMLEIYVIKCLLSGMGKGDYGTLDKMLDRLIGKVKEHIEHSGSLHGSIVDDIENEPRKK